MSASRSGGRRARMGIALSTTELWVADLSQLARPRATRLELAPYPGENGVWPGLVTALQAAAEWMNADGGSLSVALLPPLAEVRLVDLPPLAERELRQLLTRGATRYFLHARGQQTVGALSGRSASGAPAPVLAVTAPSRIVGAIYAAANEANWSVDTLTPAEGAWAAAAPTLWPAFARRTASLLVQDGDRVALLELDGGRLANVRRFRGGEHDADLIGDAIAQASPVGVAPAVGLIGGAEARHELSAALASRGIRVSPAPAGWAEHAESPDAMAAIFAASSAGPLLTTEAARVERQRRLGRATFAVFGAAAALLVAAALIQLWGVRRQLAAVRAERESLRSRVAATLVGRSSMEDAYGRLTALAAAERTAPQWSSVIATLSARLPSDAYLTAIHTRGDSLSVDGLAVSAARAFDAVDGMSDLVDVHAPSPVRRLSPEGSSPMERFTLAAEVGDSAHRGATAGSAAQAGHGGAP